MTVFWIIMLVVIGGMILGMAGLAIAQTIDDHREPLLPPPVPPDGRVYDAPPVSPTIATVYAALSAEVEAISWDAWPVRPLWSPPGRERRKAVAFPVMYGSTSTPAQREAWSKFILNGGKMPR